MPLLKVTAGLVSDDCQHVLMSKSLFGVFKLALAMVSLSHLAIAFALVNVQHRNTGHEDASLVNACTHLVHHISLIICVVQPVLNPNSRSLLLNATTAS